MVVGQHNVLSATALNALIFTELKIPFKIEEKEDGLALIAFPEKKKLFVITRVNKPFFTGLNNRKCL